MLACVAGIIVLAVLGAGFFHGEMRAAAPAPAACPAPEREWAHRRDGNESKEKFDGHLVLKASAPAASRGLLALTNAPGYKRAAEMSLRVADCTKAEDDLENRLVQIHGEILEMVMEGTEGSRTCTLSVLIPANAFREFVAELRKMGKVQSERITAQKLRPGDATSDGKENPDARELSLVAVRMADEKVAQTVLESRGILASSFDRSASHFMKGMAVLVEAIGYALPFAIAALAVAFPFLVIGLVRRARSVRILAREA
jgi:hypothetical protein